jgi:hypothetical protein
MEMGLNSPLLVAHNANVMNEESIILTKDILLGLISIPNKRDNTYFITGGLFGCCIGVTRALINLYIPHFDGKKIGHDCALTLLSIYAGNIIYIKQPLISWRKHSLNSSYRVGLLNRVLQVISLFNISAFEVGIDPIYKSAAFAYFRIFKLTIARCFYLFKKKIGTFY